MNWASRALSLLLSAFILCSSSGAQVVVPPQPANLVSVTLSSQVSYSSVTGLYTYAYTASSASTSTQEVWFISLELLGDGVQSVVNPQAPQGWTFLKSPVGGTLSWAATDPGILPSGTTDNGEVPPSPYQIKPGQSLAGFSFQSTRAPIPIKFYAQGFTPLPQAADAGNFDDGGFTFKDFTEDSIIGVTQGPRPTDRTQQESGRGFIIITGITNGIMVKAPIIIGLSFNQTAGSVDQSSFTASLNGTDITALFKPATSTNLAATVSVGSSPLSTGGNVFGASVSVTPNGATSPISDLSYVHFFTNSISNLDINGDGTVNCTDLGIVKASFGKSYGQTGFDPRADVNGDGVVNLIDLATVAKALPAGTTCP